MRNAQRFWIILFSWLSCAALVAEDDKRVSCNPCPECYNPSNAFSNDDNDELEGPCPDVFDHTSWYYTSCLTDCQYARENNLWGIWLPDTPPLFRPFIADPRQVTYSVGWRWNDRALVKNVIPVSFGDIFPVFRWCDIFPWRGDLEIGIEGAVWAVFDPLHESSPLIDADYYVGIPLSYAWGNWAIRLRGYHISTHIGDEFLIGNPFFKRKNPSIEAFDFFVSNYFTEDLRLYGGVGWLACQDDSYRVGPFYAQGGFELRVFEVSYRDYCDRLYGVPFFAVNAFYQSHFKRHINSTFALGYEIGKVSGLKRRMRVYLEYHDGYSVDGQFSKIPTHYLAIRATYGF